ncbi:MAG: insulinase family protein [Acidobacteria bacterium]|nr:insulinase family protein [Acidobacteriota bacterium]
MRKAFYACSPWLVAFAVLLCVTPVYPQKKRPATKPNAGPAAAPASASQVKFTEHKLKNGLRIYLVEDHSAPVVSISVNYDVGSRNEKKGRTGFAHLFEHMMFQGSENIGKSEHFILVDTNGGEMNGTTDEERTIYYETLPANQLELAVFLEADRMRSLDISKENLDNQRNAVQEERRLRLDNQPYGIFFEKLNETIYDDFAYKHSAIGSMEDLTAASVEDVREFFKTYYAPNNAALALVGDFNPTQALTLIKKYFEPLAAQPKPPAVVINEPVQNAQRRLKVDDPLAQVPVMILAYKGIRGNTPDAYAMNVLSTILGGGESSRLYQKLVKEKQLLIEAQMYSQVRRGIGMNAIIAVMTPGKKQEEVEAAINEELAKLQNEPIADWELEKAKQFAKRNAINARQSSLGLASSIAEAAIAWNDPNLVNTRLAKIAAVTKADVQRVAQQYFKKELSTIGIAVPAPKGAAKPGE